MKRTVFPTGVAHWHETMGQKEIQKLGYNRHDAFLMTGTEHALYGRAPLKAFGRKGRRLDQVPFQSRSHSMRLWPKTEKNRPTTSSTNMVRNTASLRAGIKNKKKKTKSQNSRNSSEWKIFSKHSSWVLCWYGAKKCLPRVWHFVSYTMLTCTETREDGRDYGQLKPTLCRPAGVTKSGQECSPRLILSVRTNSAASTYVRWIIDVSANVAQQTCPSS